MSGIDGVYWAVKWKVTGTTVNPSGVSNAPHLYLSKGKAEARWKQLSKSCREATEVVPVQLTELKEGKQQ